MDPRENTPWLYRMPSMNHYYGDIVRQLFLGAAVIMLVAAPAYTDDVGSQGPVLVVAAIALAVVAGVMNPLMRFAKIASVLVSVGGAIYFELWALAQYQDVRAFTAAFVIRQVVALIFFFALYFSMKTARGDALERMGEDIERTDDENVSDLVAEAERSFASDANDSHVHSDDAP